MELAGASSLKETFCPTLLSCTALRPEASDARSPKVLLGPMMVPVVVALSASYSQ